MVVRPPRADSTLSEASREERAGPGLRGPCGVPSPEADVLRPGAAAWLALGVGGGSREAGPPLFTISTPRPREPSGPRVPAAERRRGSRAGAREWVEGGVLKFRVTGVIHSSAYASATEWVWEPGF